MASPNENNPSGITDLVPLIESALSEACQLGPGSPERLTEAMRYAVLAPGKRLRPALVLMSAEACGGTYTQAMPGAVAVEMIHAYSLIHDDLPAMDDDDLRRGRPTVHIQFDEATAILAGDALQPLAFSHLSRSVEPNLAGKAVQILAEAAGPEHLVGGQMADLAADSASQTSELDPGNATDLQANRTIQHLESIHRRKTGALFSASLELGALLAGADNQARNALRNYSEHLGLAFQVVDDLLDHLSDSETMGKRVGKDADRGKLTYPGLLGIEGAQQKAKHLIESARSELKCFGEAAWRLDWLATYVENRTH